MRNPKQYRGLLCPSGPHQDRPMDKNELYWKSLMNSFYSSEGLMRMRSTQSGRHMLVSIVRYRRNKSTVL